MNNGEIYERGTYTELHSNPNSLYNTLEVQYKKKEEKEQEAELEKKEKEEAEIKKKKS
jgi:ABC-type glutathione transport system ATPase component